MRTRTRLRPRLLSGLLVLGVALPTTAYADNNSIWADGEGNSVTVTSTTTTRIDSPGQPDTTTRTDAGGTAAAG